MAPYLPLNYTYRNLLGGGYLDLHPQVRSETTRYNPISPCQSPLGLPGAQQGLNTGVVLFCLAKMRASHLYNELLEPEEVYRLKDLYMYHFGLGDQVAISLTLSDISMYL